MNESRKKLIAFATLGAVMTGMDATSLREREVRKTKSMCRSEGCNGYAQYDGGTKCRRHKQDLRQSS